MCGMYDCSLPLGKAMNTDNWLGPFCCFSPTHGALLNRHGGPWASESLQEVISRVLPKGGWQQPEWQSKK